MTQHSQPQFEVRLDLYALNVVIDAFSYMIEYYHATGVIDHAAWIIEKSELEAMVELLKLHAHQDQNMALVPMAESDHDTYVRLINYAGYAVPKREDRALLEILHDAYMANEDMHTPIFFTVTLARNMMGALVGVYDKLIDDPDILEQGLYDLTPWPEFLALTTKFKNLLEYSVDPVTIPMTSSEWFTHYVYSTQPLTRSDELTPEEEIVINAVNDEMANVMRSIPDKSSNPLSLHRILTDT